MKKLLLVINEDRFFLSHRTRIAVVAAKYGWDVTLVAKNTGCKKQIEDMGFKFIELPINPTGLNLLDEIKTFKFLYNLYGKFPDAIIHHVGLKNMLWGGVASRIRKTRGVVYAVSGLGTLFGENKNKIISQLIIRFLKFAMNRKNVAIIFQNHDDEKLFFGRDGIYKKNTHFIKGSGVDLNEFCISPIPDTYPIIVIFMARMLKEKGILDLVTAAELLRKDFEGKVEFWLCGGLSNNPSALKENEINAIVDNKYIKWLGHRNDIASLLTKSTIVCYPSYYREGVPKTLLEASAAGRPIVTTDSVGCRDTVKEGINGYIVPTHCPEAIADALKRLFLDLDLVKKMGMASRKIAEKEYDVNKVAERHLEIYNNLNDV